MQGFSSVFYNLKKRIHKLLLLHLSLNYSRSTKTTQCLSLSVARVFSVRTKFSLFLGPKQLTSTD